MPISKPHPEAKEVARTSRSKTFRLPNGQRRIVAKVGQQHYLQGGQWRDISTAISVKGERFTADELPFEFQMHRHGIGYDYTSKAGGTITVELDSVGDTKIDSERFFQGERSSSEVLFRDVADDLDLRFSVHANGIRTYRILKSDKAAREWRWRISGDESGLARIASQIVGTDANRRALAGLSLESADGVWVERWDGSVVTVDPQTRIKGLSRDVAFPVAIDPDITENIADNNNDGFVQRNVYNDALSGWSASTTYGHFNFGNRTGYNYVVEDGFRFPSVGLSQGATIDLAELKVNVVGGSGSGVVGTVYGVDEDDAGAWGNGYDSPFNRARTTASASVSVVGTGILTIDVTAIVQEIVDRAGYAGGAISFVFIATVGNGITRYLQLEDFDSAGTDEAQLEITLAAAGNPHNYYAQQQ